MSVVLNPPELGFKRPFIHEVCQVLELYNENPEAIVFKVKTTAPKHYCVRPNSGRIEPGKHVGVQVLLQAMKDEPPLDAKCKDKFLVQTVAVTGDLEFANVTSIFEKSSKSSVQERKIRVNWLAQDLDASQGGEANGTTASDEEHPAQTSPIANYETPAVGLTKKSAETSPIPPPDFNEKPKQELSQTNESKSSATGSPSVNELKAKLVEANSQIERLKEKVSDNGLRQRKIGIDSKEPSSSMLQQQQAQSALAGVPIQIVASLCLLSFLIAYIFF
ncbi:putative integral ER membrane protein Scs2 [Aspergillus glaucus CBS 516.65]|uniref:MSP domain-containing protein n=1 Tax=Aspergillus glaucus CBS 516.65 TaxID=1160497 RepID=A0A1L9VT59_ASPGL|nr:hypothetical protein ASPGLDRAFT_64354 [Aspergillus glaucus CBS 516.65]OJJ87080.1 hypothetical protein ASPGLDRAFT_64354 [Aspergillus glaucus CBS 516.65]